MKNKFSVQELRTKEWFKKAKDDELNARSILTHQDGTPNGVCFLSQQMAEKYLKAFLVAEKRWFLKIHSIAKLLEFCMDIDASFHTLREEAIFLTEFYVETRYPGDFLIFPGKKPNKPLPPLKKSKALC